MALESRGGTQAGLSVPIGSADGDRDERRLRCPPPRLFGRAAVHHLYVASGGVTLHLCVLTPVVVAAEECKDADDQTHHHEQRQGDPEEPPTHGNPGTKPAQKNQHLLHPPAKKRASHCADLMLSLSFISHLTPSYMQNNY